MLVKVYFLGVIIDAWAMPEDCVPVKIKPGYVWAIISDDSHYRELKLSKLP